MSDTIAAIATPVGEGGISMIRISGPDSLPIAAALFHPAQPLPTQAWTPQRVVLGDIRNPATGEPVDEVLLTYFQGPRSYTAEDVVEISAHGGVYVSSQILHLVLDRGARMAEPGEFTRRAFLNGRLDLSQAEAVSDLIAAASDRALKTALRHLKGGLSEKLNEFYETLLAVLAQLEAAIDFPEEGLTVQNREDTRQHLLRLRSDLERLLQTFRQGKIYREGARIALVGKPNVGKSSLLNALLQEDRAIVTPIPGTTRDTLEESIRIQDIHIRIIDSAGLRENPEIVEEEGIERARSALDQADLALVIFDGSQPLDGNDELLIREVQNKPRLVVLNKTDLPPRLELQKLRSRFPKERWIHLSAATHQGMEELKDAIRHRVAGDRTVEDAVVITRERHRENLVQAREALDKACDSLQQNLSEEFVALDVQFALDRLGSILGKTVGEDLLDRIFGDFCIGK